MQKTIIKDISIFVMITVVSVLLLAYVNSLTEEPIAKQNEQMIQQSYHSIFQDGKDFQHDKKLDQLVEQFPNIIKDKKYNFGENGILINEVLIAYNQNHQIIGHVVKVTSQDGYGGDISLVVGIDLKSQITGIEILSIDETVGLGMNAKNESFRNQYYHKNVNQFTITKNGKQSEDEIDALSSATITSNAFNNAVNGALTFYQEMEAIK